MDGGFSCGAGWHRGPVDLPTAIDLRLLLFAFVVSSGHRPDFRSGPGPQGHRDRSQSVAQEPHRSRRRAPAWVEPETGSGDFPGRRVAASSGLCRAVLPEPEEHHDSGRRFSHRRGAFGEHRSSRRGIREGRASCAVSGPGGTSGESAGGGVGESRDLWTPAGRQMGLFGLRGRVPAPGRCPGERRGFDGVDRAISRPSAPRVLAGRAFSEADGRMPRGLPL